VNARHRAVIVVFDDEISEVQATMIRNGLTMFAGVRDVLPARGVPSDLQAARAIAQKELTAALRKAEQERDELAAKCRAVQEAMEATPVTELEWRKTS
jgi:hypothetical protein